MDDDAGPGVSGDEGQETAFLRRAALVTAMVFGMSGVANGVAAAAEQGPLTAPGAAESPVERSDM